MRQYMRNKFAIEVKQIDSQRDHLRVGSHTRTLNPEDKSMRGGS